MRSSAGTLGHVTREPFRTVATLDGVRYLHPCDLVNAIDAFFMDECETKLTRTQLSYALELIGFEDGMSDKANLAALDELMSAMVVENKECNELQGAFCG